MLFNQIADLLTSHTNLGSVMSIALGRAMSRWLFIPALLIGLLDGESINAANKIRTVAAPENGQPVVAKSDSEGAIHLIFQSKEGPQYGSSNDNGETFSKAISIVNHRARKPGLEFTPCDMAVGRDRRVHVALETNAWKLKLPREEWGYLYTHLDRDAASFAAVQNINRKPSEGFSLAADEQGNISACWLAGKLYANVSRDNGDTFGPATELDTAINPCDCCTTSAAYGADGRLAALYREETNNERDMYIALWDQAHNKVERSRVSTTIWKIDACPMTYHFVDRGRAGYTAVWPTMGRVYFARLGIDGALLSPGEIKAPGEARMRTGMMCLSSATGFTLVAWKQPPLLKWQLFDQAGQPIGSTGSAERAGSGVAGVVDKNDDFILFR
jgi:hypothetical protein